MKTPEIIKYQRAYYVSSWGQDIKHGIAFTLSYIDWYEVKKAFFIENGQSLPEIIDAKQVVYTAKDAAELLKKEKSNIKHYYEKQLKESTEKLKSL